MRPTPTLDKHIICFQLSTAKEETTEVSISGPAGGYFNHAISETMNRTNGSISS